MLEPSGLIPPLNTHTHPEKGIPKLDDANDAGGRSSDQCTLILTEGDSAKSLAVAGLSVVGRDRFGVFPLRGKLLNVRDASATQITGNAEIQNIKQVRRRGGSQGAVAGVALQPAHKGIALIKEQPPPLLQILGLQHGKQYTDAKSLRYGHLMIMTDQDHDGSHIKARAGRGEGGTRLQLALTLLSSVYMRSYADIRLSISACDMHRA